MPEQLVFITEETIDPLPSDLDREIPLSDNALTVLRKRYLLRGLDGEPVETPAEMFWRVARVVAAPDAQYDDAEQAGATAHAFYEMLTSFRFMPNSPTFTGAGTPLGQLAACFVLPIQDDMGRDPAGIFSTLRVAALVQQTGGGNGFSFSRLRPKGAQVNTSRGIATGPVGFLRVYDKAFGEIAQGGTRRGANMAVLRVDHPDILEFIRCKGQEGDITNFNISVGITDEFMRAVEADEEYDMVNPQDGSVWKQIRAREVFDELVKHAHSNGEPGVLFLDSANQSNPVPHLYDLEATNPCVTGDTMIAVADGRGNVPIAKLAEEGKDVPVFTRTDTGAVTIRMMRNPRITGYQNPVFLVTLDDGSTIKATAEHKFLVRNQEYKCVRDLKPGDSVLMMSRYKASIKDIFEANSNSQDYMWLSHGQKGVKAEHRLIAEFHHNTGLSTGLVVHHKDYDALNNSPDNLEILTKEAHDRLHAQDMLGDNNPMRLAQAQWSTEQWAAYRDKHSKNSTGNGNPNFSE